MRTPTLPLAILLATLQAASGQLLVLHKGDDSLGFYNLASGKMETKVATGAKPHEFAVSADQRFAYVTNYGVDTITDTLPGGNTISIIDLTERKPAGEISLGEFHRPHGIERGKSGLLYVTTDFPAALLIVDPKKRKVTGSVPLTSKLPHMVELSRDEKRAWTADAGSGTVTVVDLQAKRQFAQIDVGGIPMGVALDPDDKTLYVSTRNAQMVVVLDAVINKIRRKIGVQGSPARVALSPGGKRLYTSLIEAGEVAAIDTESQLEVKRAPVGSRAEGMRLAPGGERLYVSAQGANQLVEFSLPGLERVRVIDTLSKPDPIYLLRP